MNGLKLCKETAKVGDVFYKPCNRIYDTSKYYVDKYIVKDVKYRRSMKRKYSNEAFKMYFAHAMEENINGRKVIEINDTTCWVSRNRGLREEGFFKTYEEAKEIVDKKNKIHEQRMKRKELKKTIKKKRKYIPYSEYLQSMHWKRTRASALKRAGYKCQLCNSKKYLQVHHNNYDCLFEETETDLIVLCHNCHAKFHDK